MSSVSFSPSAVLNYALFEPHRARLHRRDEVEHDERFRPRVLGEASPHAPLGAEAGVEHRRQILVHLAGVEERQREERRRAEAHESADLAELALAAPRDRGHERADGEPVAAFGGGDAQPPQELVGRGDGRQRREREEHASTEKPKQVAHEGFPTVSAGHRLRVEGHTGPIAHDGCRAPWQARCQPQRRGNHHDFDG